MRSELELGLGLGLGLGFARRGRTMAASMACLRSSSTVCRVESFSSCVIFAAIIGTLMRRALRHGGTKLRRVSRRGGRVC